MKAVTAATVILVSSLCFSQGCLADGSPKASSPSTGSTTNIPLMGIGICSGFILGTPVCIARRFVHDDIQDSKGLVGDTENPLKLIPGILVSLPFAAFTSFCEGPVYAFRNSYMAEKPFSKEQFSLGDMPEYDSSEILPASD